MLITTVLCAALTVSYFIYTNVNETHWYFNQDESSLNFNGGFMIGVFGMWNLYVISVMIFYAPSHKNKLVAKHYDDTNINESVEFIKMQTRLVQSDTMKSASTESVVTAFANKIASA